MPTFSADQLIGKTLFSLKPVNLKKQPDPTSQTIYTTKAGEPVGMVDSYILPKPGRNANIFWAFEDGKGGLYYSEHLEGYYNILSLTTQGAISLEQKAEEAKKENESWFDKISSLGTYAAIGFGLFILLRDQLKK